MYIDISAAYFYIMIQKAPTTINIAIVECDILWDIEETLILSVNYTHFLGQCTFCKQ